MATSTKPQIAIRVSSGVFTVDGGAGYRASAVTLRPAIMAAPWMTTPSHFTAFQVQAPPPPSRAHLNERLMLGAVDRPLNVALWVFRSRDFRQLSTRPSRSIYNGESPVPTKAADKPLRNGRSARRHNCCHSISRSPQLPCRRMIGASPRFFRSNRLAMQRGLLWQLPDEGRRNRGTVSFRDIKPTGLPVQSAAEESQ